jgi:T5SS/PEP-CTERM-associated repeat protein
MQPRLSILVLIVFMYLFPIHAAAVVTVESYLATIALDITADDGIESERVTPVFTGPADGNEDFPITNTIEGPTEAGDATVTWVGQITANFAADATGTVFGETRGVLSIGLMDNPSTGSGRAAFEMQFTVEGAPAQLDVDGEILANGVTVTSEELAHARIVIERSGIEIFRQEVANDLDNVENSDERFGDRITQTLDPGQYRLLIEAEVDATNPTAGAGSFTGRFNNTISLTPAAVEADEIFWNVNDGDFNEAANWEPQQVPNIDTIAVFDRDTAPYTVMLNNPAVSRLIIDRGSITFDGATLMASGGNADIPAMIVGDSVAEQVSLFLDVGNVSTFHTVLGNDAGTMGSVTLEGMTDWANGGPFVVGARGAGTANVGELASLVVESLVLGQFEGSSGTLNVVGIDAGVEQVSSSSTVIGRFGAGQLSVGNTGIETGETVLGALPESEGTAIVNEGGGSAVWEFSTELVVADQGMGTLDAHEGATLEAMAGEIAPVYVAKQAGSFGVLTLRGAASSLSTSGDILVGPSGNGDLDLVDGARARAGMMFVGPAFETDAASGDGSVSVAGTGTAPDEPQLDLSGDLAVGVRGQGVLFVTDLAIVSSVRGLVATENNGDASVTLDLATWRATDEIVLGAEAPADSAFGLLTLDNGLIETISFVCYAPSLIEGTGTIVANSSDCECGISPGTDVISKGAELAAIGTLAFDGDAMFDGATITIEASGDGKGQFDAIEVTGAADLQGVAVQFVFIDGYLPQTGDELAFLTAANVTIDAATTFSYTGAAPGFQFDVMNMGNALMFQAQSDAQPEGGEGEGEGEGDTEGMGDGGGCASMTTPHSGTAVVGDAIVVLVLLLCISVKSRREAVSK